MLPRVHSYSFPLLQAILRFKMGRCSPNFQPESETSGSWWCCWIGRPIPRFGLRAAAGRWHVGLRIESCDHRYRVRDERHLHCLHLRPLDLRPHPLRRLSGGHIRYWAPLGSRHGAESLFSRFLTIFRFIPWVFLLGTDLQLPISATARAFDSRSTSGSYCGDSHVEVQLRVLWVQGRCPVSVCQFVSF